MAKLNYKQELGYQIPSIFAEKEIAYAYLKDCGIAQPKKSIGKLYYLLNLLRTEGHLNKFRYNTHDWVTINTDIIRRLFGDIVYFYAIRDKLETDGFIQVENSYQPGKQSKKFRLTKLIQKDKWSVVKINTRNCSTTRKVIEFNLKNMYAVDHELFKRLQHFKIDDIDFFDKTDCQTFTDFNCDLLKHITDGAKSLKQKQDRYNFYKDCYTSIKAGEWRYKVDDYGRRHNNLTNMPKVLRRYLYIFKNGIKRRVTSIDIKNSQVLLLLTLLPNTLDKYEIFKDAVEEGVFYELFALRAGIMKSPDDVMTSDTRKIIKNQFFTYLFGEPSKFYHAISIGREVMWEDFYSIHLHIHNLKIKYRYAYPAQQMQKAESNIMIHDVCTKACKSKMVFAQIYDSILCLEEDLPIFQEYITEGFAKLNLKVTLNREE